jgi:hypothetical protein
VDEISLDWKAAHRFSIRLACPACGAKGELRLTEDSQPPFSDTPRRTYAVDSLKFTLLIGGEPPTMACVACGAQFPRPA